MRTLLEILLLAPEEHQCFATKENLPFSASYMCVAVKIAARKNKITDEELDKAIHSINVLLRRLTAEKLNITFSDVQNYNCFVSVAEALALALNMKSCKDKEKIKKWWLNVFSNLEIDGGELVFSDEEKTYYAKKFDYQSII